MPNPDQLYRLAVALRIPPQDVLAVAFRSPGYRTETPHDPRRALADFVFLRRLAVGLSVRELAEATGIFRPIVMSIEDSGRVPTYDEQARLARALQVGNDDFAEVVSRVGAVANSDAERPASPPPQQPDPELVRFLRAGARDPLLCKRNPVDPAVAGQVLFERLDPDNPPAAAGRLAVEATLVHARAMLHAYIDFPFHGNLGVYLHDFLGYKPEYWRDIIESGDPGFIAATVNGRLVGFAHIIRGDDKGMSATPDAETAADEWILNAWYIDPDYEGLGLGSQMLNAVLDHAFDEQHASAVSLIVSNGRIPNTATSSNPDRRLSPAQMYGYYGFEHVDLNPVHSAHRRYGMGAPQQKSMRLTADGRRAYKALVALRDAAVELEIGGAARVFKSGMSMSPSEAGYWSQAMPATAGMWLADRVLELQYARVDEARLRAANAAVAAWRRADARLRGVEVIKSCAHDVAVVAA
jgi:GNAT superfamily N-acetyltransferase/transcriptional regulator with XRE-family HTH domain